MISWLKSLWQRIKTSAIDGFKEGLRQGILWAMLHRK
jgi:hypothetical protein